jgi:hypothetical protein
MKKQDSEIRKKWVIMRMNESEYERLQTLHKRSTCRQLSEYLRKVTLQQPVTIRYRNESADEILSQLLKVKNELNAIQKNFNQAVQKLQSLEFIPEFRQWLTRLENFRDPLEKKLREMKQELVSINSKWSPK